MIRTILFAAFGLLLAAPALAGEKPPVFVKTKAMADKPAVALNPAFGYVLLRTDVAMPMHLMRIPTEAERTTYADLRARAFAEARRKYEKKLKSYEDALKARKSGAANTPVPEKPVEPTEANFQFVPFERMAAASIGPTNRFAKQDGGGSTYLQELTPGEYRLYGPVMVMPQGGAAGTCWCMGSVKVEVRAGEITDLGYIASKQGKPIVAVADKNFPAPQAIPNLLGPAPDGQAIDPRLANLPIRRASYRPVGKLPNYFGVMIGRIPEIPGVLRYDRDRIVDLTAQ
ncbi:hypothetical protein [Sphingomonas elodea]|uniref:hypothetical protein n=1 Tax=Sphingomonas elodea TaxID=179878 RepID=UPI0002631D80|nr:hypothetical protein [Sphingomonas elodea]